MRRIINNFLLSNRLDTQIFIGALLSDIDKRRYALLPYQEQDGDIPAIYKFQWNGADGELLCYGNVIIGISFKLDCENITSFFLEGREDNTCTIDKDSELEELIRFLHREGIVWDIDPVNTGQKSLGVRINNTTIMYSFGIEYYGFYQISSFDTILYKSLVESDSKN